MLSGLGEHRERVRGVLYLAGVGFDWSSWQAEFHRERLARLSEEEAVRLAALDSMESPGPDEEREWMRLCWGTDYRDRRVGEERVAEMLAAGFAVNHTSNRLLSRGRRVPR